jgi:poly(3-hydroxybutyrate) depolymerase
MVRTAALIGPAPFCKRYEAAARFWQADPRFGHRPAATAAAGRRHRRKQASNFLAFSITCTDHAGLRFVGLPACLMLYLGFQTCADLAVPLRALSNSAAAALSQPLSADPRHALPRALAAVCELIARAGLSHRRPAFGIDRVEIGGQPVAVREIAMHRTPFCTLLHFAKDGVAAQPPVLLVAPMSGHFATLLRGTVETLLPDHDVYVTDWHNARDIALHHGPFGFDDFVEHIITFLEVLGAGTHIVGVCQPCVAVLAAVAIMAEDEHPAQPPSMTLMAGPIDTRINPTEVNRLATSRPIGWFERHLIDVVPPRYAGAWRRVYPGFTQLAAFMAMNFDRHVRAQLDLLCHLTDGEKDKAATIKKFYDEYLAVMDLPAEFYLETVRTVFQECALPLGRLKWRGRVVDPRAIRHTALFTVEGERDDICAVGQTMAAQELCTGLRPYMKRHHVQTGVGHYGVFNGRRWRDYIYPILHSTIYASA